MKAATPPRLLQAALHSLLSPRDRETVAGDLMEAYAERCATGASRADIWYAVQVMSFVPSACSRAYKRWPVLVALCCFTALCGLWLGTMDIVLRHKNLAQHEAIAGLIVGQGLLTLAGLPFRSLQPVRWFVLIGALAVMYLGGSAWWATLHSSDMEGYILIIGAALVLQALLTWRALLSTPTATTA